MEVSIMATNMSALQDAIKLVAKAAGDILSGAADPLSYLNLLPDLIKLVPEIGDIPVEVSQMVPADYAALAACLAADLAIPDAKIAGIVSASLGLLGSLVSDILPAVEKIVAAVRA
jgi:hypothetical protein